MRNVLMKVGRFAYLLPYLILPFVCMIAFHEDLPEAFLLTFFLPFGIESFAIILFPVSWLVSLAQTKLISFFTKEMEHVLFVDFDTWLVKWIYF